MRRLPLRSTAVVASLVASLLVADDKTHEASAGPRVPNVLIIIADDQATGTMRAMPRTWKHIAMRGVWFPRAAVNDPLCCPSRASILTGGYAHTTGVYTNGASLGSSLWAVNGGIRAFTEAGNEARTLAAHLDATHETALFGKYLNGYPAYARKVLHQPRYIPPGWNEWHAFYEPNAKYYDYKLNVNGSVRRRGDRPRDYSTDLLGDHLMDWLRPAGGGRDPSEPFFAVFAPYAPHQPATASPMYGDDERRFAVTPTGSPAFNEADVSDKPGYIRRNPPYDANEVRALGNAYVRHHQALYSLDRQVGRVMGYLERTGLIRNTIVIYLSDNGFSFGEHRWRYKLVPYEASIRVPFAIRYDRIDDGHRVRRDLALNVDVFPTVMELVFGRGWTVPHPVDGRSLLGAMRGAARAVRGSFPIEHLGYPRGNVGGPVPTYCGLVTTRWKYVVYSDVAFDPDLVAGRSDVELYDLVRDPYELRNVARTRPHVAARLRAKLAARCNPTPPGWMVRW